VPIDIVADLRKRRRQLSTDRGHVDVRARNVDPHHHGSSKHGLRIPCFYMRAGTMPLS
jgi:hypothetical protein